MARVTVEDCILNVPNRFELVMLAARRARQLSAGAPLTVDRDNDKNAVVSLREIAAESIDLGDLKNKVVRSYQTMADTDIKEEDTEELSFDDDKPAEFLMAEQMAADAELAGKMFEDVEGDDDTAEGEIE